MKKTFEDYLLEHDQWEKQLLRLQKMMVDCGLEETIKWGMPTYTLQNKNILGLGAFKEHIGIWFFQGVFLEDKLGVLRNAQEGKTKAMRSWQIRKGEKINIRGLTSYVKEAMANHKKGLSIKPDRTKKKKVAIPIELQNAFTQNKSLLGQFGMLTPGRQREFAEYIAEAKQEKTRLKRLEKCIPMIAKGIGLNDRYKK